MVRAPCCDKMGLKKGPWTPEEDQLLISYIQQNGHANWRALPKQAGLLRCGKSCRLRWINYLRPDIKRGNFTKEEEDTIIHLHDLLGNRWSAMAAKLPGRTDNEIKNVWHTHIKKKLEKSKSKVANSDFSTSKEIDSFGYGSVWSQNTGEVSALIFSSVATTSNIEQEQVKFLEARAKICTGEVTADQDLKCLEHDNGMDFWYDIFRRAEDFPELPEF